MWQVKSNRFLNPHEPPQRIFWYFARQLGIELSNNSFNEDPQKFNVPTQKSVLKRLQFFWPKNLL